MSLFIKLTVTAITSALLLLGGLYTGEHLEYSQTPTTSSQSFGSFQPVGGQTYSLQGAGVTATQNTITLTSFTTPDGRAITMAMVGSIGYGTLEPNTSSKIEDITFSGITQNTNGTAVLTGVTRGNDFVSPYAATASLAKAHAGGSYFILSNTAGFYGQQFLFSNNVGSSTAVISFSPTAPPQYFPSVGVQAVGSANSTTSEFASIAYVNAVTTSGAPNASTAAKGIVQLSTAVQAAAGTSLGSTGASLVPPNSLFNATQSATTIIPVTNTSGKLSQLFLDLTQAFTPSGIWNFTANIGQGTSSPYAALSIAGASGIVANKIVATSTATSTFINLSASSNASTTNLVISGTCTKGNGQGCNQVTQVTNTGTLTTTLNGVTTVTATCSGSQVVSGGGYTAAITNGPASYSVYNSAPSASNAWQVTTGCMQNGCTAGTLTVYAMCVNP